MIPGPRATRAIPTDNVIVCGGGETLPVETDVARAVNVNDLFAAAAAAAHAAHFHVLSNNVCVFLGPLSIEATRRPIRPSR